VPAAYRITSDRNYLDAMVRYTKWIMANEPHERPFKAFGIQAANVLDIGQEAGLDFSDWVLDHVQKHCPNLQVSGSGDPRADGGFRGEDEREGIAVPPQARFMQRDPDFALRIFDYTPLPTGKCGSAAGSRHA